jgi:NAD(P)-dependent dehydrogenase (short-subunit alcohol dehydrogenase family)
MSTDVFDLTGQVAVITGGGTGIGRATAHVLAEHGADVVLASRREENLEQTSSEIRGIGRRAVVKKTDVRKLEDCRALIATAHEEFGRIDILVNNAGGSKAFSFDEWTFEEFENSIALNLRSFFFLSQSVVRHMVEQHSGNIVNISSIASLTAMPGLGPYGMAKAGVNNLTRFLAAKYGADNIRVNCIAPGFVGSDGFARAMNAVDRDPDDVAARSNAMGRAGRPEEIALPILFLVSAASSFLSGETIYIGGGPPVVGPWP